MIRRTVFLSQATLCSLLGAFFVSLPIYGQEFMPRACNGKLATHAYYSLSYVEQHEQPEWVYYILTPAMVNGVVKRVDRFRADPSIATESATPADYKNSGYDRGHLAPAADMKISSAAMSESFFMSNISPQQPSFNRGIWKKLEAQVRAWALEEDTLYVVAGPIFRDNLGSIGVNKVTVPGYYYKIVYADKRKKMIGFVMPNRRSSLPLPSFVRCVNDIEQQTGIDFFYQLEDSLENRLEESASYPTGDTDDMERGKNRSLKMPADTSSSSKALKKTPKFSKNLYQNKPEETNQPMSDSLSHTLDPQAKRCRAATQAGSRCARDAAEGSVYCWQHRRD